LEHLPEFWQAFLDDSGLPSISFSVGVTLERGRDAPLSYTLACEANTVVAHPEAAAEPTFQLLLDVGAYRIASRDLWPRAARRLGVAADSARIWLQQAFATIEPEAWLASLLELPGELEIQYTDDAGDTCRADLVVGSGRGSRARIVATDADISLLLEGKSSLWQLVKSRALIEGDSGWVLRLVARLSRRE
jgi:hypothetical protein